MAWSLIGHGWAAAMLRRHIARGQVRHAYLIAGPDGIGKRTLALRFAQALTCHQASEEGGEPCGACRPCRTIWEGSYSDLHLVKAAEEGGSLKVEQVRELGRRLALAPYEGKWRIALLEDFDAATVSAANALLKTLEEPPDKVILLLTARNPDELLPTVVSRCELVQLRPVPSAELEDALREAHGVPAERARRIVGFAAGRPGEALRLAQSPERMDREEDQIQELLSLLSRSRAERLVYAERMAYGGGEDRVSDTLQAWLGFWREALLVAAGVDAPRRYTKIAGQLSGAAKELGMGRLFWAARSTEDAMDALARRANPRLALEVLVLDLPAL